VPCAHTACARLRLHPLHLTIPDLCSLTCVPRPLSLPILEYGVVRVCSLLPHPEPPMPAPCVPHTAHTLRAYSWMHASPPPDPLPLSCPHSFVNRLPSCNRVRVRRHLHLLRSPAPTTAHSRGCLHRGALWYPCPNALRSTSRRSTWSGRQLAATQEEAF